MKNARTMLLLAVGLVGFFFAPVDAWATKGGGGEDLGCVVDNPGMGSTALRGVIAVDVTSGVNPPAFNQEVDFTLRLGRGGFTATPFFRLHKTIAQIGSTTNEGLMCQILGTPASGGPSAFATQIIAAFGLQGTATRLVITPSSITNTDQRGATQNITQPDGTQHVTTMADIVLYAQ